MLDRVLMRRTPRGYPVCLWLTRDITDFSEATEDLGSRRLELA
jgi:hypothetical protein